MSDRCSDDMQKTVSCGDNARALFVREAICKTRPHNKHHILWSMFFWWILLHNLTNMNEHQPKCVKKVDIDAHGHCYVYPITHILCFCVYFYKENGPKDCQK